MSTSEITPTSELSEREREILRLVATGASNKEIAHRLHISPNTVKVHLRNIFAKIGVTSRTEAALYAVREGLVQVTAKALLKEDFNDSGAENYETGARARPPGETMGEGRLPSYPLVNPQKHTRQRLWRMVSFVVIVAILLIGISEFAIALRQPPSIASSTPVPPTAEPPRWQTQPEMPTARSNFAVAIYDGQIYAIAGEDLTGPIAVVEKFDPATQKWFSLEPKPLAVADVQAAVIGGKIYVPGGRTADGLADRLEVFNPRGNQWEQRAPLPVKLSAYAMVAFEGKLYVFGGWDGQKHLNTVYEYNPDLDTWVQKTSMPTARSFAGAAVVEGKIYVIGGKNGSRISSMNETYSPEQDSAESFPWASAPPLPLASYGSGITSIAERLYVIGGQTETGKIAPTLVYAPQTKQWESVPDFPALNGYFARVITLGNNLYVLGGRSDQQFSSQNFSYRGIYTVVLPIIR